jgi:hypothetical protein
MYWMYTLKSYIYHITLKCIHPIPDSKENISVLSEIKFVDKHIDRMSPTWTIFYVRRERIFSLYGFARTTFFMTDCTHRCQSLLYVLIRCKIFPRSQ